MRIYPLSGDVTAVDAPEGHFEAEDDGGFDLPDTLQDRLHSSHVGGKPQWETDIERGQRENAAALAYRQSPEALYGLMEKMGAAFAAGHAAQEPPAKTGSRGGRRAASNSSSD